MRNEEERWVVVAIENREFNHCWSLVRRLPDSWTTRPGWQSIRGLRKRMICFYIDPPIVEGPLRLNQILSHCERGASREVRSKPSSLLALFLPDLLVGQPYKKPT